MAPEPRNTQYEQSPRHRDDVAAQGSVSNDAGAQPDGNFTNLHNVSMGSSEGRADPIAAADGHGNSVMDKAKGKAHRVKDRLDSKEQDTRDKFRKAFGLRVRGSRLSHITHARRI